MSIQGTPRRIDNHALSSAEARIVNLKSSLEAKQKLAEEFEVMRNAANDAQALCAELASAKHGLAQMQADSLAYEMQRIGSPVIAYTPGANTDSPIAAKVEVIFSRPDGEHRTVSLRSLPQWSAEAKVLYAHPEVWPAPLLVLGNGDPEQAMAAYLRGISRGHL